MVYTVGNVALMQPHFRQVKLKGLQTCMKVKVRFCGVVLCGMWEE